MREFRKVIFYGKQSRSTSKQGGDRQKVGKSNEKRAPEKGLCQEIFDKSQSR